MNLHVVYRTSGAENQSRRPPFYSKVLCAQSLVAAFSNTTSSSLTVVNDGPRSSALEILRPVADRVIEQERRGNSGSYLTALDVALGFEDCDWAYFVEDDYLHSADALSVLESGMRGLPPPVDYLTLYEHPNSYRNPPSGGGREWFYLVESVYWRTVTASCMTFAGRIGAIREDEALHRRATRGAVPDDFGLWLAIQGARIPLRFGTRMPGRLRWGTYQASRVAMQLTRTRRSRQIVVSLPSRCTHLDLTDGLAPGVDWEAMVQQGGGSQRNDPSS